MSVMPDPYYDQPYIEDDDGWIGPILRHVQRLSGFMVIYPEHACNVCGHQPWQHSSFTIMNMLFRTITAHDMCAGGCKCEQWVPLEKKEDDS